jgi:hypothetical protein
MKYRVFSWLKDEFRAISRAVFAFILLTGSACAQVTQAAAIPPSFFGVSQWNPNAFPEVNFGFLAHGPFSWAEIEPAPLDFSGISLFDSYVSQAMDRGLPYYDPSTNTVNMAITLGLTPSWATADQTRCKPTSHNGVTQCASAPDEKQYWVDFLTYLFSYYNGKDHPYIKLYELWNEADDPGWWGGWNTAARGPLPNEYDCPTHDTDICPLVRMAESAYTLLHNNASSMLLTPSVTGTNAEPWMKSYLAAGGDLYADGGAYHGYIGSTSSSGSYPMPDDSSAPFGSVPERAITMRRDVFNQSRLRGKPMFQTEGSWGNANVTDSDTQVAWLARYYLLQAGLYESLNLKMAAWFAWDGPAGWGVIDMPSGDPSNPLVPTPAGQAYSQVYNWLEGSTVQPCNHNSKGTWKCTIQLWDGSPAEAVWYAPSNETRPYVVGAGFTSYFCLDGQSCLNGNSVSVAPGDTITITNKPIMLVGSPKLKCTGSSCCIRSGGVGSGGSCI